MVSVIAISLDALVCFCYWIMTGRREKITFIELLHEVTSESHLTIFGIMQHSLNNALSLIFLSLSPTPTFSQHVNHRGTSIII